MLESCPKHPQPHGNVHISYSSQEKPREDGRAGTIGRYGNKEYEHWEKPPAQARELNVQTGPGFGFFGIDIDCVNERERIKSYDVPARIEPTIK